MTALAEASTDPDVKAKAEKASAAAVAAKQRAEEGISCIHVKKVESHGKDECDGASVLIAHAISAAITSGALLDPGTRELVLFCAQLFPAPATPKELKDGWGAPTEYFFGFMDSAKFTKGSVPDAEARGWDCNKKHVFIGRCADRQHTHNLGPLETAPMFCSCDACLLFDFDRCEMAAHRGPLSNVKVPLKAGVVQRINQIDSLLEWGALLKVGMVVAVRVPLDQRGLWPEEGDYWLVHIDSEAFEAPADLVHSTEIEEGWLIIYGRFYSKEQKSPCGYKLAPESQRRPFVVNSWSTR